MVHYADIFYSCSIAVLGVSVSNINTWITLKWYHILCIYIHTLILIRIWVLPPPPSEHTHMIVTVLLQSMDKPKNYQRWMLSHEYFTSFERNSLWQHHGKVSNNLNYLKSDVKFLIIFANIVTSHPRCVQQPGTSDVDAIVSRLAPLVEV